MADTIEKVLKRGNSTGENFAAVNEKFAEYSAAIAGLEQDIAELPESFNYLPLAGGIMDYGASIHFKNTNSIEDVDKATYTGDSVYFYKEDTEYNTTSSLSGDLMRFVRTYTDGHYITSALSPGSLSFTDSRLGSVFLRPTITNKTLTIDLPNNSGTLALVSDVESALAEAGKIDTITVGDKFVPIEDKNAKINVSSDIQVTEDTTNKTLTLSVPELANKATSLELSVDPTTYVLTAKLKNKAGEVLGTEQTVDLPLETMVVSAYYDELTKEIVLTLQNGTTTRFSVADLVSGLVSTDNLNKTLKDYLPLSGGTLADDAYLKLNKASSSGATLSTTLQGGTITIARASVAGASGHTTVISAKNSTTGNVVLHWGETSGTIAVISDITKNAFGEYAVEFGATTLNTDGTYTQTFVFTEFKLRPLFVLNSSNKIVDVDWEMVENGWILTSDIPLTGTVYFASMTI